MIKALRECYETLMIENFHQNALHGMRPKDVPGPEESVIVEHGLSLASPSCER